MKKQYKIAFCGLGSIGRRHLKNVIAYLEMNDCSFRIDAIRSGIQNPLDNETEPYITDQYTYQDEIPTDYDIIFITNPTSMHRESIIKYGKCARNLFIEKPVMSAGNYLLDGWPEGVICYVACPLRYTQVLQYVKQMIDCDKAYCVRAICSTYLPDWRQGIDYRDSYSAHRDMGGGVSIDLIHEWDYITWLFGRPDNIYCIRDNVSELEVDSDDIAVYVGRSADRVYELHLDYFGKEEVRGLEIYMPDQTVKIDIRNGRIHFARKGKRQDDDITFSEDRNAYQMREIEHFFQIIEGECENDNTVEHAVDILKLTQGEMR